MAKKIFISYKHSDNGVQPLKNLYSQTTVRDYVNKMEDLLEGNHIYKGERDNEDLNNFKDETIKSHLRDKIHDSSVTIVLISKNMKETYSEEDQWIPWEISYSLKEIKRDNRASLTNAMLAVVLPDENGSYEYAFTYKANCGNCIGVTHWNTNNFFQILNKNMFNLKNLKTANCGNVNCNNSWKTSEKHSYIVPINWKSFISKINRYVELAISISENIEDYNVEKQIWNQN